jgi:hypothetical protein
VPATHARQAILRAYDAGDLSRKLYDSGTTASLVCGAHNSKRKVYVGGSRTSSMGTACWPRSCSWLYLAAQWGPRRSGNLFRSAQEVEARGFELICIDLVS